VHIQHILMLTLQAEFLLNISNVEIFY